jgi:hypothetical protein
MTMRCLRARGWAFYRFTQPALSDPGRCMAYYWPTRRTVFADSWPAALARINGRESGLPSPAPEKDDR